MKQTFFAIAAALFISMTACAKADMPISAQELPQAAQSFVKQHFPEATIATAIQDFETLGYTFEVRLSNLYELEFDKAGEWLKVDCQRDAVPVAIIPANIVTYVAQTFPNAFVTEIGKEAFGFNVELNTGLDLDFDKAGNFKRIDD